MAQPIIKAKPMVKDEIIHLLEMISKHKVITSKSTNATNNKCKEDAWKSIALEFSAVTGSNRRPEQLRLKWENLKKAARKRSAMIRQNNFKTGGGTEYIPPDEVLDRVASVLGATCTGMTVEFGGDWVDEAVVEVFDVEPLPELPKPGPSGDGGVVLGGDGETEGTVFTIAPKTFTFDTPKNSLIKRRKLSEEVQRAQRDKDLALADYFKAKAEKVRLESRKIELENMKLESEMKLLIQKDNEDN